MPSSFLSVPSGIQDAIINRAAKSSIRGFNFPPFFTDSIIFASSFSFENCTMRKR